MAETSARIYKKGILQKRQRCRKAPKECPDFQERYCILTSESLSYYKVKRKFQLRRHHNGVHMEDLELRDSFPLGRIKIIKDMLESVFKRRGQVQEYSFQVGDEEEVLYFGCKTLQERSEWMQAFQDAAVNNDNVMLTNYHEDVYSHTKQEWTCCRSPVKSTGCVKSRDLERSVNRRSVRTSDRQVQSATSNDIMSSLEKSSQPKVRASTFSGKNNEDDSGYNSQVSRWPSEHISLEQRLKSNDVEEVSSQLVNMKSGGSFYPIGHNKITCIKFVDDNVLALSTDDNSVYIYNVVSGSTHDIKLKHPICSIDVWRHYLVIGSSMVHVVDTREDHWKRIVVLDKEERDSLKDPAQHLAVFSSSGQFATASTRRSFITVWPQPTEEDTLITTPQHRCHSKDTTDVICRILSASRNLNTFVVLRKTESGVMHIDIRKWMDSAHLRTISLDGNWTISGITLSDDGRYITAWQGQEILQLTVQSDNDYREKLNLEGENTITDICHVGAGNQILIGESDGSVKLHERKEKIVNFSNPEVSSSITYIALSEDTLALGHEDGALCLWGVPGKYHKPQKQSLEFAEATKFSVYLPGSFTRKSLVSDIFTFEADSRGGKFSNIPSYSLTIPTGAIKPGTTTRIQTGIVSCGPFKPFQFPKGIKVVSPAVWFCANSEMVLEKKATLQLQHCSNDLAGLQILKAGCSASTDVFKFEPMKVDIKAVEESSITFSIDHFCVFCVGIYDSEDTRNAKLCIIPVEGVHSGAKKEVIFCLSYMLDTCKYAVEEQYKDDYHYEVRSPVPVSLAPRADAISIKNYTLKEHGDWRVELKSGSTVIPIKQLNFWDGFETATELRFAHDNKMYPPRFHYCITQGSHSDEIKFEFSGFDSEVSYTISVTPFAAETSNRSGPSSPERRSISNQPIWERFPSLSGDSPPPSP